MEQSRQGCKRKQLTASLFQTSYIILAVTDNATLRHGSRGPKNYFTRLVNVHMYFQIDNLKIN